MPLDAVCLTAVASELKETATGCKIEKIYQPERDELIIALRGPNAPARLLLSASNNNARIHFTDLQKENPSTPPMFCMLMRKHLTGAKISSIIQPPMERVLDIEMDAFDEMGTAVKKHLITEIMGRHSNIILTGEDGRIIDCLRRVDAEMSEKRQVLPGLFYRLPPAQDKLNPLDMTPAQIEQLFTSTSDEKTSEKWLLDTFLGISPLICRELAFLSCGETDMRISSMDHRQREDFLYRFTSFLNNVKANKFTPFMLAKDGRPFDFYCFPVLQYGKYMEIKQMSSFSKMLDEFYYTRDMSERIRQRGQSMIKSVTSARDRTARRLALQQEELKAALGRDRLRELGDIVTANLHLMSRGMSVLKAADFFDPENPEIEIKLNPLLTPQQNAARYYKDYTRAKTAEKYLSGQIASGKLELEYLNSVLEEISKAEGERDLQEIRQELVETGYLRRSKAKKAEKQIASKPLAFRSDTGYKIFVGKNNRQNDTLTMKTARKTDLWFHTQKIHGSHVIISCEGNLPDTNTIEEAAVIAAYYSQARESGNVPVDYTAVRNVKKPPGSKPGMVIYDNYKTVYVTPDEGLVKRLSEK